MAYSTPNWTNGSSPAINATNLTNLGHAVELASPAYGVCSTAAATAAKSVTVAYTGALSLFTGLTVSVKFANGNTAPNPTLAVNGTAATPIISDGSNAATLFAAGQVVLLVYDGTNWMVDGIDGFTKTQTLSNNTAAAIGAATGTTPTSPDEAFAQLLSGGSGVSIATGSYVGTGTAGAANKNSLTFAFVPKIVIIGGNKGLQPVSGAWKDSFLWMQGQTDGYSYNSSTAIYFQQSGSTLTWWVTSNAAAQLNTSGMTYRWVAIG